MKELAGTGLLIVGLLASFVAYFQHIVTCLNEEAWAFLIAGALIPPVAIIHGMMQWF